ncbi:universal stress protein [Lactiplantibacillus mudanjiangensis]|uniref:Universal stress protein [Lactobacillus pentosus] n=1 Tax=Lactiplantibacillus mudanjiangensis TaxID=1296538 RepID=A0A660E836_9LACO|nr:universal stress protein [Lactiplantibacillus mudanjiangensis]VDG19639.1 universal stress protein [Lactobacillus pentosus] [Lactiplantibacillus mudanjiangensis]VDG25443.1 universal stress protein [Lactobacillus pentosus] [Lactiplantibacillus mudanjiangensis]VDG28529.1 universal stress protein [Lactobacillus pentosus] [Lactiplantibacillus mudanjiangensis]VDG31085.1 universal stress protein [Lactobacillus pentosus] [Lactiplantibacillus mudanjiangensis]
MYKRILVPLDGSDNAYLALDHAIKLARTFDAKLFLLSVIDITRLNVYSPSAYGGALYTDLLTITKENRTKILDRAKFKAESANVETLPIQINSIPKTSIATEIPDKYDIDLIVIGKSGTNAISRLFLGSTTAYVVRKATANVMVINMPVDS